ncbi:MAG: hypothetical protein H0V11_06910, partial [Actinobacteria bacterium]|nr:hypothetical protein [Actinomycetota bacterium]
PPPPPPPPAPPPPPPPPRAQRSALFSPFAGARLTAPPLLRWRAVPKAHHFNVQVYRNGRKILSRWPTRPQFKLRRSWTERGRTYGLRPGVYTWFVWPAYSRTRYGRMLGRSSFRIVGR